MVRADVIDELPQPPADADANDPGVAPLQPARHVDELRRQGRDFPGAVEQFLSRVGQVGAVRRAPEQRHAELFFQVVDLPGQRRLRDVEPLGRPRERMLLGNRDERPEIFEVHEADYHPDVAP